MTCGIQFETAIGSVISFETNVSQQIEFTTNIQSVYELCTTVCEARARAVPFLLVATQTGSETFTLDNTPLLNSTIVNLEGVPLSSVAGDFSVTDDQLTVNDIKRIGDTIYGLYYI